MKVLKFGGSSVATAERIRRVASIVAVARRDGEVAVVVSALGGVTDVLVEAASLSAQGESGWQDALAAIAVRHVDALEELADPAEHATLDAEIKTALGELHDLLHGVFLLREASPRTRDAVMSYGERLSSYLVAAALRRQGLEAEACDARELIRTDAGFGGARVEAEATDVRIRAHFAVPRPLQVVTGFLGATRDGQTTTLGRGGSDYTAALLGAALEAPVELWTDVDGVMSADPRIVPGAAVIERLSYNELMELSHFGAKVVYPPSVHPLRARSLPLWIKNTFDPDKPGTFVAPQTAGEEGTTETPPVRGVAAISRVALLRLEGDGMVGVPGFAMRLFGALAREKVNVILISQASSEHSICFAVDPGDASRAVRGVDDEFALEHRVGQIDPLIVEDGFSVVAAVGSAMRHQAGLAGRIFGVLGERGVNVHAIAQGSSERNISLVVAAGDRVTAVEAMHDAFVTGGRRRVDLVVAGTGRVGGAFLRQLAARREALLRERGLDLRLVAVATSRQVLRDGEGLDPMEAIERVRRDGETLDVEALAESLAATPGTGRIFVDATASAAVGAVYERLLTAGVSIVTANKLRPAGSAESWRALCRSGPGRLHYETTVGAGLPVISSLATLLATGDRPRRIEGVLSGTLAYLADCLAAGMTFSEAVRDAHERGFTEPDPREDLGGQDVARKLLILARRMGRDAEPEDVTVEPLLPDASWWELSLDDFWRRLSELDDVFAARQKEAETAGGRLAYVARVDSDGLVAALEIVGPEHSCGALRGTDNLIAVFTDRYTDTPLVIRGPGAGPEVTAAGIFADVLQAATAS